MNQLCTPSYASQYLKEHSDLDSVQKQINIEEIIFDYSRESSIFFDDDQNNKVEVKKHILFDPARCDSSGRESESCTKCINSCEFDAIKFNTVAKNITLIHQNCTSCSKCVNICPTASLQQASFNINSLIAVLENANQFNIIFCKEIDLVSNIFELPKQSVLITLDNYYVLNELNLLISVLKSGGRIVFLAKELLPDEILLNIKSVNKIINAINSQNGVHFLSEIAGGGFGFQPNSSRVENMSARMALSTLLKTTPIHKPDIIETESKIFATLNIDSSCTACMGCAFVCKSSAFIADEKKMALTLNESLCTACGFCVSICPEKSIKITTGLLNLQESGLSHIIVATDEIFHCIECGKAFATKKAIEKVSTIFSSMFTEDHKKRTLYCCADCKPKVMMSEHFNNQTKDGF